MRNLAKLSIEDGILLVQAARKIVTEYLKEEVTNFDKSFQSRFSFESGIFVTINNDFGLRGCIGLPLPDKKLYKALSDAAIAAATEDPRFPPIKIDELENITFEVTVLTPPSEIKVEHANDYLSQIKIGRDGLIVRHSFFSGLLLPQVPVEYGWTVQEFLEHTCEKAGLSKDHWKKKDTKILKFEGIVFKEEKPMGKIIEEKLI
jgi:uncharacterized protein